MTRRPRPADSASASDNYQRGIDASIYSAPPLPTFMLVTSATQTPPDPLDIASRPGRLRMPWPAKPQAAWNQSAAPDGSHRSRDQKDAGDPADRAEHLERVPHAC